MTKRGYDSYGSDEATRQAGGSPGDSLFGRPGSINERIRLGLIAGLMVTLAMRALVETLPFAPMFAVIFVVTMLAVTASDWLTRPYRGWPSHGFVGGLTTAALFTVLGGLGMPAALYALWSNGRPLDAAFEAAVALLVLAIPTWLLWLIWGAFRRAYADDAEKRPAWHLALAPSLIVGTVLVLAALTGGFFHRLG